MSLFNFISSQLQTAIIQHRPISGGDISNAFLIETREQRFFLKQHPGPFAYEMFRIEQASLDAIAATGTIATPLVHLCIPYQDGGILLMDYIEPKRADSKAHQALGEQLAALHQCSQDNFGWSQDNYIGKLAQSNRKQATWLDFYWQERLLPQLKLAQEQQLLAATDFPTYERVEASCASFFREVRPALLHGDLWSGNYLISTEGKPYLIDPALYYGHNEVDIAMTKLFGGFGPSFYDAYRATYAISKEVEAVYTDLYQLYYLLVHLNLFGASYYSDYKCILKKYFL